MFKKILAALLVGVAAITSGCSGMKTEIQEDYSFSLTWGVNGVSSYDSSTGKLVKNLNAYPEKYDPYNAPNSDQKVMTRPSQDIILVVNLGDEMERIKEILLNTDEWQALPDYEFYYD